MTPQHKLAILTLIVTGLTAHAALANSAPNLRNELSAAPTPNGAMNLLGAQSNIPTPSLSVGNVSKVPTVLIAQTTKADSPKLDVSLVDDFIDDVSPNARHYPPNFPNRTSQHNTAETVKYLAKWLEPYASDSNASTDVLLRAAKINALGRNLDLGSEYAVRAVNYLTTAIKREPNHAEANYLMGMILAEGGGFKESQKYLDKAASLGYIEAEQTLAQSDLLNEKRDAALSRLQRLKSTNPSHPQLDTQIAIVQNGGFYIWDIKDNNIKVAPLPGKP